MGLYGSWLVGFSQREPVYGCFSVFCIKMSSSSRFRHIGLNFKLLFFLLFLKTAIHIVYYHRACEMQSEL